MASEKILNFIEENDVKLEVSENNFGKLEIEEEPEKEESKDEVFDPVNLIETLDPYYEEKQEKA